MINTWDYRPIAVVESDDTCDRWDRNGLNFLFYWKAKYPKFKITIFTIPERTSKEMLYLLWKHNDWIEIAVHGWNHESNFECYSWDYERTHRLMERVESTPFQSVSLYKKIFKAPGWTITGGGHNGYPPDPSTATYKDPTAVYRALNERGYLIVDRNYNDEIRPKDTKAIVIDREEKIVHMHTWNMETGDKNGRNGYQQVEEEQGVPWDNNTEFYFMSEAWEKGILESCHQS